MVALTADRNTPELEAGERVGVLGASQAIFAGSMGVIGQARGGKVRVLALASTKPTPRAPELPLLTKDIAALDINNWFGLMGPAALPGDIKAALAQARRAAGMSGCGIMPRARPRMQW